MPKPFETSVPSEWEPPVFFATATPEETAIALDVAARLLPLTSKTIYEHDDHKEACRREGIQETVQIALEHLRNDAVDRAIQDKNEAGIALYDAKDRLEESRAKIAELSQALAVAQASVRDAEDRGKASAILENDARIHAETNRAAVSFRSLEAELRNRIADISADRDRLNQRCEALQTAERKLYEEKKNLEMQKWIKKPKFSHGKSH